MQTKVKPVETAAPEPAQTVTDDEKYIVLLDIRSKHQDYVGLQQIIRFLFVGVLLIATFYLGSNPAAIKIKNELFEIMEVRGEASNSALDARTYGEVKDVYTKVISKLQSEEKNSTLKDGSLVMVSSFFKYDIKRPGAICGSPAKMPTAYSDFEYQHDNREKLEGCPTQTVAVYIYRTKGLRDENAACVDDNEARRGKCREQECTTMSPRIRKDAFGASLWEGDSHCDDIGDWIGAMNGTTIKTAKAKLDYMMEPKNGIVFPNTNMNLYMAFYHPESGYFFNMELAYKLDETGRYQIKYASMSRAAPLNPFHGLRQQCHFAIVLITTMYCIYEFIKQLRFVYKVFRGEAQAKKRHYLTLTSEDLVFAWIIIIACAATFWSNGAYFLNVYIKMHFTLETVDPDICWLYTNHLLIGSTSIIIWLLVLFGKLRFHQGTF